MHFRIKFIFKCLFNFYTEGGGKSPLQNWNYHKLIKRLSSYLTPKLQIYKVNKNTIKS